MDDITRFERQTIENLHHNVFTSEERENAVKKLWDSGKYKSQDELAKRLGIDLSGIGKILKAYEVRKEIKSVSGVAQLSISTRDLVDASRLKNKTDRQTIIKKVSKKEIPSSKIREVVRTIKTIQKKAPELKK